MQPLTARRQDHAHAHHHAHDHAHDHPRGDDHAHAHDHAHDHAREAPQRPARAKPGFSLLRASAAQRLAGVAALIALLWLGVWWAL
jgi:hypothetical protein